MNTNPLLGQVLGGLFGQAMMRRGRGGMGGGLGGIGLGSVLGGMMRGGRGGSMGMPAGRGAGGGQAALLMMLLPLAMRWVQRNGGVGAVLDKFKQKGLDRQAKSWISTGANDSLGEQAVEQVVGRDELSAMAQRLGVPEHQVTQAFAEIMPEMVDKLSPGGQLPREADEVLEEGARTLEKEIEDVQYREVSTKA